MGGDILDIRGVRATIRGFKIIFNSLSKVIMMSRG